MFRAHVLINRRSKLHYTASGIITPIGVMIPDDRPRCREVAVPVLWPVPEVAVTVFSTPDDECCDTRNMQSDLAVNKYLHTVASGWIFINICSLFDFLLPQAPASCCFGTASFHKHLLYYINTVWFVTVATMDGRVIYLKSIDTTKHFKLLNIVYFYMLGRRLFGWFFSYSVIRSTSALVSYLVN